MEYIFVALALLAGFMAYNKDRKRLEKKYNKRYMTMTGELEIEEINSNELNEDIIESIGYAVNKLGEIRDKYADTEERNEVDEVRAHLQGVIIEIEECIVEQE